MAKNKGCSLSRATLEMQPIGLRRPGHTRCKISRLFFAQENMISGSNASEIFSSVRTLVESDQLKPGDLLPPVRELAEMLGINRNTVASAYRRLCEAGIAVADGRRGTSISLPPSAGEQEGVIFGDTLVDLADGNPAPDLLIPAESMSLDGLTKPHLYGDETILPELRILGMRWLGPDCPEVPHLELTNGAIDAIERIVTGVLIAGDRVAVEDPCYLGTMNALRLSGMQAVGVEIDSEGMVPKALEAVLEAGARAVLLTPRAHNPTGCSLTSTRARALRRVLAKYPDTLLLIDDHFALVAESEYHSVLHNKSLRWALVRSVSKGFGPDMRLAFVGCDADTGARLRARLAPGMHWVSQILQTIVLNCLKSSEVQDHLQHARARYASSRRQFVAVLKSAGIMSEIRAVDGLNVWLPLAVDERAVIEALAARGWRVRQGSAFAVDKANPAIRVTISRMSSDMGAKFAKDLTSCVEQVGRFFG
jgi:DNA-binding transcriptional MocR family regulator